MNLARISLRRLEEFAKRIPAVGAILTVFYLLLAVTLITAMALE